MSVTVSIHEWICYQVGLKSKAESITLCATIYGKAYVSRMRTDLYNMLGSACERRHGVELLYHLASISPPFGGRCLYSIPTTFIHYTSSILIKYATT